MKKQLLTVFAVAMLLIVPVSVYAYSNIIDPTMTNTTLETTTAETNNYPNNMMDNYTHMSEMMRGNNTICTVPEQHAQFIEDQKLEIEQQLENEEITQEQANKLLEDLEQMLTIHKKHHNVTDNYPMNCHK